jgi:hypothetical protein
MKIDDATFIAFLDLLARIRARFNDAAIFAEQKNEVSNVEIAIYPTKHEPNNFSESGFTLEFYLHADLLKPISEEHRSLGMSFLIRGGASNWIVETDVGWSGGQAIGWDPFNQHSVTFTALVELGNQAPALADSLRTRFVSELSKLTS